MGFHAVKACALAALAISASAQAQVYPAKPIRMIVAYPPGGGTDIVGRMVAQKLGETLGQSVLVENRGGASGNIGTELAARAAPDGYTILMGNVAPNAINVSLFKDLPFDPVADFAPVSLVASTPNILVVHPSTPARTVKEVIALAKAKPGTLNFASAGVGSSSHLAGGALPHPRGRRYRARAVQGRGAGDGGCPVGTGTTLLRDHAGGDAACEAGEGRAGRGHERAALAGLAGSADDRGVRRAGVRSVNVVRGARAGAYACRGGRPPARKH